MIKNRKSILGKIKYLLLLGVVFLSLVGYSNAQEIYDCSALVSASLDKSSLSIGETLTINYSVLDSGFTATDIFRYGTNHGIGGKSTSGSPDTNIYSHAFQNIDVSVLLKENSGPGSTHCFVGTITVSGVCGDGDVSWNELISALEITTESASSYGGGMVQHFESEYVDQIVRNLLQLRAYTLRLRQETQKGLLQSREDLQILVEGMYDFSDRLDQLMQQNGFIRKNFQYALDELKSNIQRILAEVMIGIR